MNSEGLRGILIKWKSTNRNYVNAVEGVDYDVIDPEQTCNNVDGSPVTFTEIEDADKYEWLMKVEKKTVENYDNRIYIEHISARPTNIKNDEFINFSEFQYVSTLVRRSNDEIIEMIKQEEANANLMVLNESDKNKLDMLLNQVLIKQAQGIAISDIDAVVLQRASEVAERCVMNASNAKELIRQLNANLTPNLSSGWQTDNITPLGYPFNDL